MVANDRPTIVNADIDDPPFADPKIRRDYEAALGRLILAYNEVDFRLTAVLLTAVQKMGRTDRLKYLTNGKFEQRLCNLAMLSDLVPQLGIPDIDFAELRQLNNDRNNVAHGHFDQNPYDGSYVLLTSKQFEAAKRQTYENYPISALNRITDKLKRAAETLHEAELAIQFDDLD